MFSRVMGGENEYALTALDVRRRTLVSDDVAGRLVSALAAAQPTLADGSGGVFLANGARCYVDCGRHPEYSTPECADPRDVVRHIKAGERLLLEAARRVESSQRGLKVMLLRTNVDYSGSGATWGAHESYMHKAGSDWPALVRNLVPHLLSRIVYTGAGGFDPMSHGLRFMVSPRARFFERVVSSDSTRNRGIFHTKNEPLGTRDLQRVHVVCGEGLGSATATVLKFGTTALILALIEQGVQPGKGVEPRDPVAAFHLVAADTELSVPIALADGGVVTALQMQRHYLMEVERHIGEPYMPSWAEAIARLWGETLDALERGVEAFATKLDWAMRYALFMDRAARIGLERSQARLWTEVLDELGNGTRLFGYEVEQGQLLAALAGAGIPIFHPMRGATERIREARLSWDDGRAFLAKRSALLEADMRFAELGEEGLFAVLDRGGQLTHAAAGVERIDDAMGTPPRDTRAKVRGEYVRRAAANGCRGLLCRWDAIWNRDALLVLDLSSPLTTEEKWRRMTPEEARTYGSGGACRVAAQA